jgi:hypothetical protein
MKNIRKNPLYIIASILLVILLYSCEKLPLYKDFEFESKTLDPQQGITAWEYLNKPRTDTLFNMMLRAIKYAGMEEEYKKSDRTYILLTAQAFTNKNATTGVEAATTYFARRKVNGASGKKIQDYSVAEIRNLLKYHIVQGYHTYGNLTVDPEDFSTLRTDSTVNVVTMNINNNTNYKIQFNNFPGSAKTQDARTSNLQMKDNCVIHVIDTYMEYGRIL